MPKPTNTIEDDIRDAFEEAFAELAAEQAPSLMTDHGLTIEQALQITTVPVCGMCLVELTEELTPALDCGGDCLMCVAGEDPDALMLLEMIANGDAQ